MKSTAASPSWVYAKLTYALCIVFLTVTPASFHRGVLGTIPALFFVEIHLKLHSCNKAKLFDKVAVLTNAWLMHVVQIEDAL